MSHLRHVLLAEELVEEALRQDTPGAGASQRVQVLTDFQNLLTQVKM